MKYFVFDLQCKSFSKIETEVRFDIAVARSGGGELVRFNIDASDGEILLMRRYNFMLRILANMRKNSAIQFYALSDDFTEKTMKAEFLYNKYSDFVNINSINGKFIYVKL